ncbi:DUF4367 domain-containing protein [Bacillus sp. 2205SS5-2]|uniref:DUF4367 domain-containing protein n=1 Tax=Bacillus sp. 2205SS5-2 TaxID=3109031 RepID=UPI003006D3F1
MKNNIRKKIATLKEEEKPIKKYRFTAVVSFMVLFCVFVLLLNFGLSQIGIIGEGRITGITEVQQVELMEAIENEPFQAKLPTFLPFEQEMATFTPAPTENQRESFQSFQFYGVNGEFIDMKAFKGGWVRGEVKTEEIKIGDFTGYYLVNEQGAKIIFWEVGNVDYDLATKDDEISKDDLIRVAKSFK